MPVAPESGWSLDAFVALANDLLPQHLPVLKANSRVSETVNTRLVRQYATDHLIDPPDREGREARYHQRHLLQLLVTRRLMANGMATPLIASITTQSTEELARSLGSKAPTNAALQFLETLGDRPSPRQATDSPPRRQSWTRMELVPGIELHIRNHHPLPRSPDDVRRLIELALSRWPQSP